MVRLPCRHARIDAIRGLFPLLLAYGVVFVAATIWLLNNRKFNADPKIVRFSPRKEAKCAGNRVCVLDSSKV